MKRREFLKSASILTLASYNTNLLANENSQNSFTSFFNSFFSNKDSNLNTSNKISKEEMLIHKEHNLINKHVEDKFIEKSYHDEFLSVRKKLRFVQSHVGYGNFNIISFDEMLNIAKNNSRIEAFTKKELEFFESIFYYNPSVHGFYGQRISLNITDRINKKDVRKVPRTGHYLFKGEPEKVYYKMLDDIGESIVLTSGVRSIVKQSKLFLDKIYSVDGNLTVASKSLAPPAYTYHTISDFDVGKKGLGAANFTARFALTQEFFRMRKLKYIDMRYTINNKDGVRYEPWHVKVI